MDCQYVRQSDIPNILKSYNSYTDLIYKIDMEKIGEGGGGDSDMQEGQNSASHLSLNKQWLHQVT